MVMFEGDDHALSRNATEVERLMAEFVVRCAGARIGRENGDESVVSADVVVGRDERADVMRKGGDLRGPESIE